MQRARLSGVRFGIVAAIIGALVAGGLAHMLSTASNEDEQIDRERKAAVGALVLSVRTSGEKQREAVRILRASGGTGVEMA